MEPVPVAAGALYVALGGAVGSVGRYLVGVAVQNAARPGWIATLIVNVLGAFVMGVLLGAAPPRRTTLLLGTGILGGFTTFSTLTADVGMLFGPLGDWRGLAYAFGSVTLGIGAFYVGRAAGAALGG